VPIGVPLVQDLAFLPTAEEQAWLIDALEDLLRRRGRHPFLSMPLVQPTPEFFPDPWSFTIEGLDRIVRRLMQYANLVDLDVQVGTFEHPGFRSRQLSADAVRSVAGLFLGLDSGCAHFAFNETAPSDPEYMAGVMAHEVAHAYRTFHQLADEAADRDREEWLTDVTAAYLGFGVLVANNSYRYRTSGEQIGYRSYQTWSVGRAGYLSPQAFAYLLAIQMEARGLDEAERKRISRHLEANQAAFTKTAAESILAWPEDTFRRLQFPGEEDAISSVPLESILLPLPEVVEVLCEADPSEDAPPEDLPNFGRPVFRLMESRALGYSLGGFLAGIILGASAVALVHEPALGAAFPLAGLGLGWRQGNRHRQDLCSEPECRAVLGPDVITCPGCGGTVAGSIRHPGDRLAAEEEYERNNRPKRRARPMKRRHRKTDSTPL